jgi:hypothetical protein
MNNSDIILYFAIGSMVFTGFGLLLRYALKSKCSRISICGGLFVIERDIDAEERIEECKITHNITTLPSSDSDKGPTSMEDLNHIITVI